MFVRLFIVFGSLETPEHLSFPLFPPERPADPVWSLRARPWPSGAFETGHGDTINGRWPPRGTSALGSVS